MLCWFYFLEFSVHRDLHPQYYISRKNLISEKFTSTARNVDYISRKIIVKIVFDNLKIILYNIIIVNNKLAKYIINGGNLK